MNLKHIYLLAFLTFLAPSTLMVRAQARTDSKPAAQLSYSDATDLVTASPFVIKGRINSVKGVQIESPEAIGAERKYLLVAVDVESLIRGDNGVSPRVTFLAHPADPLGASPLRIRKQQPVMLFVKPVAKPGQMQLVSRNAMQPWTVELEATARAITAEAVKADAPPAIKALGDAFHIEGSVAGESETQIFVKTVTGAPISLSVIRRPGQAVRWGVSLDEIIDEAAAPPARDTLLWYRLACGLPRTMPDEAVRELSFRDADAVRRDYAVIMESLGSCGRTL